MSDDDFTITVSGIEETLASLDELPRKMAIQKALVAASVPIVNELRVRTPIGNEALAKALTSLGVAQKAGKYGTLQGNLGVKIFMDPKGIGGTAVIGYGKMGHVARWLEYGHRIVTHKPKKREVGQVQARPFIRPAFDATESKAEDAFEQSITLSLEEEGK